MLYGRGNATGTGCSVGLVLAVVQLWNGKTGALGPYGATVMGRADAWLCSVLCVCERENTREGQSSVRAAERRCSRAASRTLAPARCATTEKQLSRGWRRTAAGRWRLVCAPLDRTVGEAQGSICGPACPVIPSPKSESHMRASSCQPQCSPQLQTARGGLVTPHEAPG
jgi:hypothetical protein